MSKPVHSTLGLLLLAGLGLLLLAAAPGAAFQPSMGGFAAHGSRTSRRQRQQAWEPAPPQVVVVASSSFGPLRSTSSEEDPTGAAAAAPSTPLPVEAEAPKQEQQQQQQAGKGGCKNFPNCDGSYRNRGCDGLGKIQGGIATVPFLGWWPIKVRRSRRSVWLEDVDCVGTEAEALVVGSWAIRWVLPSF